LKILIVSGANIEAKDYDGRTALHSSAYGGIFESVTYLIVKKAEVNARDKQNNTPLHILGKQYDFELDSCLSIAEELIYAGADLTAVNNEGKTPMDNNRYVQQLKEQKPELFL
jgi:ankyrin repeat protein